MTHFSEEDDRWIDRYVRQELSADEQSTAASQLQQNEALHDELRLRQSLKIAATEQGRQELKALLVAADKRMDSTALHANVDKPVQRISWYRWIAAAAIALLLGVATWSLMRSPSSEDLYAAYYEPFPNLIAPIDKSQPATDLVTQALQAYERGQFAEAVDKFIALEQQNSTTAFSPDMQLYYALSLLQTGNANEATNRLQTVAANLEARYQQAAQWYLALAYLQTNNQEKTAEQLNNILATPEHRYQDKAKKLLEFF